MESHSPSFSLCFRLLLLLVLLSVAPVRGMRFVVDKKECFEHKVEFEYDTVYASYVIIKTDSPWTFSRVGVDVTVEGPHGQLYYIKKRQESDKFDFIANKKGHYTFCFSNQSPMHETIDFDVHVGHLPGKEEVLAKPEHFSPLMAQLSRLEEALYSVRFEQHWLSAQTAHQAIVSAAMSRRIMYKAFLEATAVIGASLLQVYLLQRLFERKLGKSSRV